MEFTSIRNIPRMKEITSVLVRHGLDHVVDELGLPVVEKVRRMFGKGEEDWAEVRESLPVRLRNVLQELGPTYVKLGQILSTRRDILPDEYIEELVKLQDDVPPMPFDEVAEIVGTELGAPIDELFDSFDEQSLAAASIGQVHRAVTKQGDEVVVKVQRRDVARIVKADMDILKSIARLLRESDLLEDLCDPVEIVEEFSRSIARELDYTRELRNIVTFARNFSGNENVIIPRPYPGLTTSKVLCMEFIHGIKASDADPSTHDVKAIARVGVEAVLQQVFLDGCFHADPHPGNILVVGRSSLAFVDFGMVGRLGVKSRDKLSTMLHALFTRNYDLVARELVRIAKPRGDVDLDELAAAVLETIDPYYGATLSEVDVSGLIRECIDVISRFRMTFPPSFSMMLKALMTVESLGKQLDPDFDMLGALKPFLLRLLGKRFQPDVLARDGILAAYDIGLMAMRIPVRAERVLTRMEQGEFTLKARHEGLRDLCRHMDEGSNRIAFSLVISSCIIGSSLVMTKGTVRLYGVNMGAAMWMVAGFLGIWLAISILRSGRL